MPIEQLLLNDDDLPVFIPVVCEYLMNFSHCVGIFRLCGNHTMVQDLGIIFNLPECAVPPCASVHDVSSFLKQWLRDLPVPLIPPNLLNDIYNPDDEGSIVTLLKNLPVTNRKCLASIFAVIQLVFDQAAVNQMGPANIATCFVGSFLQNSKGLTKHLPFMTFFNSAMMYLNDEGNDFILP
ncbi:RhoGAP domain containing protein [Histomonas meleagridis]|uniref:RhoGAP domain containing protein n=1 Tax=Histomonas meleagridis TaxID=135588 RepID=UPI003559A623|nr:RhoGAP domain containing protein [Histomonas meleagridis]KAH0796434.1 RhoGAP domain containing protein [Histomonas meleagridis]